MSTTEHIPQHAAHLPAHAATSNTATSSVRGPVLAAYAKFFVHLTASVLGLLLAALSDGVSPTETAQLVLLLAGTAMVYNQRNGDGLLSGYAKAIVAWLVTVLTAVVPVIAGGWADLAANAPVVLVAVAGALGVGVTPNAGTTSLGDSVRAVLAQVQDLHGKVDTAAAVQQAVATVQTSYVRAASAKPAQTTGGQAAVRRTSPTEAAAVTLSVNGQNVGLGHVQPPVTAGGRPAADPVTTGTLDAVAEQAAPLTLER